MTYATEKYHAAYYQNNKGKFRQRNKIHRERRTFRLFEYLSSHPCVDCNETDPIVLEFDHVRGEKISTISALVHSGKGWDVVEAEIAKCEVRCANCHRRKTAAQVGYRKLAFATGQEPTPRKYSRCDGCRVCGDAKTVYNKKLCRAHYNESQKEKMRKRRISRTDACGLP